MAESMVKRSLLPGDDGGDPDRSKFHTDASPVKLRDQLNENWRQLRIFSRAVADRDRVIGDQHKSIETRDETIRQLNRSLWLARGKAKILYALLGGAAAKGCEVIGLAIFHHFVR